jgi:hypothetical protein
MESVRSHAQDIAQILRRHVLQEAAATGTARRDVHPKAQGLVAGTFTVADDVPENLRSGLCAAPGTYQNWVRFSNGSPKVQRAVSQGTVNRGAAAAYR